MSPHQCKELNKLIEKSMAIVVGTEEYVADDATYLDKMYSNNFKRGRAGKEL